MRWRGEATAAAAAAAAAAAVWLLLLLLLLMVRGDARAIGDIIPLLILEPEL